MCIAPQTCEKSSAIFLTAFQLITNIQLMNLYFITERVRSTTGRLCIDTCLSVCLQGVPRSGPDGGVPQPGPDGLTLDRSRRGPSQVQMGGEGGTLARSRQGVPQPGPDACTLARSRQGGTQGGVPLAGMGYPPAGMGYPTSGNRWSTWYAAVGMPLAFTQDFLLFTLIEISWRSNLKAVEMLSRNYAKWYTSYNCNQKRQYLLCDNLLHLLRFSTGCKYSAVRPKGAWKWWCTLCMYL